MDNQITQPKKKSRKWLWVIGGFILFIILISVIGGGGEKRETGPETISKSSQVADVSSAFKLASLEIEHNNPSSSLGDTFDSLLKELITKCPKEDETQIANYIFKTKKMIEEKGGTVTLLQAGNGINESIPEEAIGTISCAEVAVALVVLSTTSGGEKTETLPAAEIEKDQPTEEHNETVESDSETIIENHCQSEWSTDAQMKSYCKKQQYDGLATLNQGKPSDILDSEFNIIRNHCKSEWPADFKMRAYCEKQQYDGVRTLNQGKPSDILDSEFNIIRNHCESEWPTDFKMRAYCEKQQYDGVRTLNQGKPAGVSESDFNFIRSTCANEWPTDFKMRAYCEKQKF